MTPTIMHRPDIALVTSYLKRRGDVPTTSKIQQCSSLLPQHYGRFLHQASSMKDPLYALGELFTFVATAQSQFFNMIEQQIDTETARLLQTSLGAQGQEELNSAAISNFLYNKSIIEKHIYVLRANVRTLEPGGCQDWPNNTEPKNKYRTSLSQDTILYDFVYLLSRAEKLSAACDRGINIAGNNAMVMESKRAGRQAAYMSRLTLLAFFYIPASFSTSAFGMNLTQLGQGDNPFLIYIWLGVLLACYIVTYFVWVLDLPALLKKWTTWLSNHVHSHSIS